MNLKRLVFLFAGLVLVLALGGCSGGGGGSSSDDDTANVNSRFAAGITELDQKAVNNEITDEEFLTEFEQLIDTIEAEPDGVQNLADYLESEVMGNDIDLRFRTRSITNRTALSDTLEQIKNTETYQMLEAFFTTAGSSLLPEPISIMLDLSQPEVFKSFAAVQVRTHIIDSEFSGNISADTASGLMATNSYNPFDAQRDLLDAAGQEIPDWLQTYDGLCLRDCEIGEPGTTGIYSGSFYGTTSETGLGCVWNHTVDVTITVVVTGSGTLADPYDGTIELSGDVSSELSSGSECDPGGDASIDGSGTVEGTTGKFNGLITGVVGAANFTGDLTNATVSTSVISGAFTFNIDGFDNPIVQTVTLIRE